MNALKAGRLALQIIVLGLLGACAGGGGGGGGGAGIGGLFSPPPPPPPPPPAYPSSSSSEYTGNWAVAGTNAIIAWQNGATGAGVKVGVIDDGIEPNHPELAGRVDTVNSIDIVAGRNALTTSATHGSELAALIAGNFNGAQTVGLAFNATIVAVRADNGAGNFNDADVAAAINHVVSKGVKVVNLSLGRSGPVDPVLVQAISNATAAGVIFTISAGNDGQGAPPATQVNYPGFYASDLSVSHGLIIIAGGLNPNGSVNPISNPPGTNASWYLTAPAWQLIVPDFGPSGPVAGLQVCGLGTAGTLCRIQGTSYAAPQLAGAVALVMSAFPGMTPAQVVNLLLTTADDTGAAGVDSVNGRGRLNIGRAFQPVGQLSAPLTQNAAPVDPSTPLGALGPAFGDGFSNDPGEWATVAFDAYDRTFNLDFSQNWLRAAAGPALIAQAPLLWETARAENGLVMSFAQADSVAPESVRVAFGRDNLERDAVKIDGEIAPGLTLSFAANGPHSFDAKMDERIGHLGFVNADSSLSLTRELTRFARVSFISESGEGEAGLVQEPSARRATAARLGFGADALGFDLTYGRIADQRGVLGLAWAETLGDTPGGGVRFAGFAAHAQPIASLNLRAQAELGVADMRRPGWLFLAEPLRTSAFELEASYDTAPGGTLSLTLSQPLRVDDGLFTASLPTATNYGRRSLSYETRAIDPTPSGRELRLGLGYRYFAGDWLSAFGEAMLVNEPGHVAGADPAAMMRFGVRLKH